MQLKEIILIRHGHGEHMAEGRIAGWHRARLTDLGRREIHAAGKRAAKLIDGRDFTFFASDLPRARESAQIISQYVNLKPRYVWPIREFSNGIAAVIPMEEAMRKIKHTKPIGLERAYPYAGSEDWDSFYQRVSTFLEELPFDRIILATHKACSICIQQWWFKIPRELFDTVSFEIESGSITYLYKNAFGEHSAKFINDTSHLEGVL